MVPALGQRCHSRQQRHFRVVGIRNSQLAGWLCIIISIVFFADVHPINHADVIITYQSSYGPDAYEGQDANYCRNPDGSDTTWCYTVDPNVRWDYCDYCGALRAEGPTPPPTSAPPTPAPTPLSLCDANFVDGVVTGNDACCTAENQCGVDEGDCDIDADCAGDLICGTDNCNGWVDCVFDCTSAEAVVGCVFPFAYQGLKYVNE